MRNRPRRESRAATTPARPAASGDGALLEVLFEAAPDAIVVVGEDGRVLRVNRQVEVLLGWARAELLGRPVEVLVPERFRRRHETHRAHYLEAPRTRAMGAGVELWARCKDGAELPVDISLSEARVEGSLVVVAVVRDVSARRRAERELRESQERLQAILDNSPAVIYVKDRAGRYVLVNRRYETIFGIGRDDVVGKTDHDVFPREKADAFLENDRRVLASGTALAFEEVAPHADGPHTYVSVKFPLRGADGAAHAVCGISTDITERKRAEEGLRRAHDELEQRVSERTQELSEANAQLLGEIAERKRAEERLGAQYAVTRGLAESASLDEAAPRILRTVCEGTGWEVGEVWLVDATANVLRHVATGGRAGADLGEWAAVARRTTFGPGEGLPGQVWTGGRRAFIGDVTRDPRILRPGVAARLGLRTGIGFPIAGESGTIGVLTLFGRGDRPPDAETLSMLGALGTQMGQFIERRRAEDALRDALERVAEANRRLVQEQAKLLQTEKLSSIGLLAAGVAHEINNPLSGVMGCIKALRETDLPSAKREEYFETVRDALERIRQTVRGLLDYARERSPSPADLDVADVVGSCVRLLAPLIRKKMVRVAVRLDRGGATVHADRSQLMQAITNVLMNAVHATPRDGEIAITAQGGPGRVGVRIADSGPGIPRALVDRICDPFFTTKPEGEGTGLGLAITLAVVRAHGGELAIESEPGKGAAVTLWLPGRTVATSRAEAS